MSEITTANNTSLLDISGIEKAMLAHPQRSCEVFHYFGPNIYVRGVNLPADTFAIGHTQKTAHLNVMIRGKVIMVFEDNTTCVLTAPQIFVSEPGKKTGYIVEDTLWLNIYATSETDISKLEEMFLEKSEASKADTEAKFKEEACFHEASRLDYQQVLKEFGFTEKEARQQSENTSDQIDMPRGYRPLFAVRPSPIEGLGVFASASINVGEQIGIARLNGARTPLGRYVNHSITPNAKYITQDNDIYLVATKRIDGCKGGSQGTEITVDYRQTLSDAKRSNK